MSQLRSRRKVLFGEGFVWISVRWNVKQQICSMVDLINVFNVIKVPQRSDAAELFLLLQHDWPRGTEQRAGWPSSHHTLAWELRGMCIPVGEVLTEPVQLCVRLRLLQQVTVHTRFSQACKPKTLGFWLRSELVGWGSTQDSEKNGIEAKGSLYPLSFQSVRNHQLVCCILKKVDNSSFLHYHFTKYSMFQCADITKKSF